MKSRNKIRSIHNSLFIVILILLPMFSFLPVQSASSQYFFRVRLLSKSDDPTSNIANLLAQDLRKIRIDAQLLSQPEGAFESSLLSRDFDIVFLELDWPTDDVNPNVYFSEEGSGNYWGLDSGISGGDLNEELLIAGITANNTTDRIDIYNDWQENLMNNILPIIPLYNKVTTHVCWNTLTGWDHDEGIVASLPYMEWSSQHSGQVNQSVFIDYIETWKNLNALFTEEDFINYLVSEPLFRIDENNQPQGVLATSWIFNTNQTELTIDLRKNVKWQADIDNLYLGEYFDAEDVEFTILMFKEISTIGSFFSWIDSIEQYNSSRIVITIDGDQNTPGLQPYAPALYDLTKPMLPEHYLNMSVDELGIPNTNHPNWAKYSENGLGTGMYKFEPGKFNDGIEAVFYYNPDWWGSTVEGYNEDLDIKEYKFRFLFDQTTRQLEFEGGKLDIFRDFRESYTQYKSAPYIHQTKSEYDVSYIGFNLKSLQCLEIHDETLTEDETMSKGLAVRKAIAHLIDKTVLDAMLDIEIQTIDSPFSNKFNLFVYSNITKYEFNTDQAKAYMDKAGFDPNTLPSPGFNFLSTLITIFILATLTSIIIKRYGFH